MFNISKVDKFYLYPGATDFCKGINELSILVGENLKTNCIYVFCNSRLKENIVTWIFIKLLQLKLLSKS